MKREETIKILKETLSVDGNRGAHQYWITGIEEAADRLTEQRESVSEEDMEQARVKAWESDTWVDTASFRLGFRKCWEWLQSRSNPEISEEDIRRILYKSPRTAFTDFISDKDCQILAKAIHKLISKR